MRLSTHYPGLTYTAKICEVDSDDFPGRFYIAKLNQRSWCQPFDQVLYLHKDGFWREIATTQGDKPTGWFQTREEAEAAIRIQRPETKRPHGDIWRSWTYPIIRSFRLVVIDLA